MKFKSVACLIAVSLLLNEDFVGAQGVTIEDEGEVSTSGQDAKEVGLGETQPRRSKKKSSSKLTPEQIAEIKKTKKAEQELLEACLVLTRAHYYKNEKMYTKYIENHPSTQITTKGDDKAIAKSTQLSNQNKNMLLSKINGGMLLKCKAGIQQETIQELQKYKDSPEKYDTSKRPDVAKLVEVNFDDYNLAGMGVDASVEKITFTTEENQILAAIEDVSDTMNQKKNKEMQASGRGAVSIAFFDVSQMSGATQAFYLLSMLGVLAGGLYKFYHVMVIQPEMEAEEKKLLREKKLARKAKKQQ